MSDDAAPATGPSPATSDPKATLHRYLRRQREALMWKLDGISEYDARRPMTPTGTNLVGLLRHTAGTEADYFGVTFDRPADAVGVPWAFPDDFGADVDPAVWVVDMWAPLEETREDTLAWVRRAWAHADTTIEALDLDAVGRVPWWPAERAEVTLHQVLVHVISDYARHAGHADILRELIDGQAGMQPDNDNLPTDDPAFWPEHVARVEAAARAASGPE